MEAILFSNGIVVLRRASIDLNVLHLELHGQKLLQLFVRLHVLRHRLDLEVFLALHHLDHRDDLLVGFALHFRPKFAFFGWLEFGGTLGFSGLLLRRLLLSHLGGQRIIICVCPLFTRILSATHRWVKLIKINLSIFAGVLLLLFLTLSFLHLGLAVWIAMLPPLIGLHLLRSKWLRIYIQLRVDNLGLAHCLECIQRLLV